MSRNKTLGITLDRRFSSNYNISRCDIYAIPGYLKSEAVLCKLTDSANMPLAFRSRSNMLGLP